MTGKSKLAGLRAGVAICAAGALLGGCVGKLETTPHRERTARLGQAMTGVSYSLPKLQYEITLTRMLSECPGEMLGEDGDKKPSALVFTPEIEATASYVPGEAYNVNYERLAGLLRKANFDMKWWPNGTLKSVGAGAEDMTGEVLKDAAKTVLAIASSTAGGPALFLSADAPRSATREEDVVCTAAALKAVQDVRKVRDDIKKKTTTLDGYKKEAELILARAAVKLVTRADRDRIVTLHTDIADVEGGIAKDKARLAKLSEGLAVVDKFTWDGDLAKDASQVEQRDLSDDQIDKLQKLLTYGRLDRLSAADGTAIRYDAAANAERKSAASSCFRADASGAPVADIRNCIIQQLNLTAAVVFPGGLEPCSPTNDEKQECLSVAEAKVNIPGRAYNVPNPNLRDARDDKADSGIFVREPVQARLVFCRTFRLKEGEMCSAAKDVGKIPAAFMPQAGQLRYLPLRVGPFEARELAVTLTEEGRLETFSYKSTKAAMQAAAATAADVATQYDAAREKRETEARDDLKNLREQQANLLQDEITKLQKELELKKLQTPNPLQPVLDETAALQADIALLQARLARIKAEQALSQAQSPADGGEG